MENMTLLQDAMKATWPLSKSIWDSFRLRELSRQLNNRFEERLAERTRIAQELHDTLLQGFISASMQLHVAADRLPADSLAKAPLGRVLQLMEPAEPGPCSESGRKRLQALGIRGPEELA